MSTPEHSGKPGEMGENPYADLAEGSKINAFAVERDATGTIIEAPAPKLAEQTESDDKFESGQTVWIRRSSGQLQEAVVSTDNGENVITHWEENGQIFDRLNKKAELLELQKTVAETQARNAEDAPATPEAEHAVAIDFKIGDTVSVNRKDAPREHDWKIERINEEGKFVAVSPDGILEKPYTPEQLSAAQFVPGDTVKHFDRSEMKEWSVFSVKPDGEILLMRGGDLRPSGEDNLVYRGSASASTLFAEQQPGYIPPKPETPPPSPDTEAAQKPSLRQRLGNRIAGK